MTSCTYDVLRAAGLIPALVCRGCGNTISAHVTPWPGERYVTHPNNRCATAALREATGETNSPGPLDQQRKGLPVNTTIDLKCLTRRADLLADEAQTHSRRPSIGWTGRLEELGEYGRSGGSAADRRQIIETLAAIEQGAVKVTGTDLFSLQVLTRDADLLAKAAKRVTTARLTWEGLATIEPTPGSFAALASMMTFIERGTVTAQTIPPLDPAA
ncbi:MAG: hypothetical protein JHD16_00115 [Solirubrobacteraceae bacterium]|nr:hypothetical protein [Solirubrobacteraceae bacterium]